MSQFQKVITKSIAVLLLVVSLGSLASCSSSGTSTTYPKTYQNSEATRKIKVTSSVDAVLTKFNYNVGSVSCTVSGNGTYSVSGTSITFQITNPYSAFFGVKMTGSYSDSGKKISAYGVTYTLKS